MPWRSIGLHVAVLSVNRRGYIVICSVLRLTFCIFSNIEPVFLCCSLYPVKNFSL